MHIISSILTNFSLLLALFKPRIIQQNERSEGSTRILMYKYEKKERKIEKEKKSPPFWQREPKTGTNTSNSTFRDATPPELTWHHDNDNAQAVLKDACRYMRNVL